MDQFTTFKVGGKADILAYPKDIDDLRQIYKVTNKEEISTFILGLGSNLLVKDNGIRGVVINLTKGLNEIKELKNERLFCEAGKSLASLVAFATNHNLGGLEFLSGIPGTVGGAIKMNAGAFGGEISDYIESVSFINNYGELKRVEKKELRFSYRKMSTGANETILNCIFALVSKSKETIKEEVKKHAINRSRKQPMEKATAGSVFKNPFGDSAGKLIEESGLKGMQVGQAKISEKHANFIENLGGAKATDILSLIDLIKGRVLQKSDTQLELEIEVVGECPCNGMKVLK